MTNTIRDKILSCLAPWGQKKKKQNKINHNQPNETNIHFFKNLGLQPFSFICF